MVVVDVVGVAMVVIEMIVGVGVVLTTACDG